jgi:signal transduction histidine kinase/CheY-like chemotaxis protein
MDEMRTETPVRVLLLEDSRLDAEMVVARLERSGFELEVATAFDRASYFEELEARAYDVILADYALPDFDGVAALDAAREKNPHVPFIFISGRVGEEVAIETLQRGATDYVLKQRLERLVPAVKRALREAEEHATRMRVEQRFKESETRFRHVLDALPQMVWIAASDKTLIYTNKVWAEGVRRGTQTWLDPALVHPQDMPGCEEVWQRALETHEAFSCECRLMSRAEGTYHWNLVRMVPLIGTRTEDGSACVDWLGTATDLQEQKLNEEALRTAEKLAVTGRMLAAIAHEINNPLESLTNLIFLTKLESQESPRALEYLAMTENELARVSAITKQTLQFYRDPITPSEVDARSVLEEVLRLFATRLASKRIEMTLDVEEGIFFRAIKGEIRQVLINLVGNAIDAVGRDGAIEASARLVEEAGRAMVRIEIRDNGAGVAEDKIKRLFQPFFSTKGSHGTGLGLWVSKGIVEKHEGTIRITSLRDGEGNVTTAMVTLPLTAAEELVSSNSMSGEGD